MEKKQKIFIVDDSEMNREILKEILGEGYEYLEADNGREALALLQQRVDIDLVLLDITMPEVYGFGVLEMMNQYHWIDELPVMIISSESDAAVINHAYELGVMDYIQRPFNAVVVQRRVSNMLMLYARQNYLVQKVEEQVLNREKSNDNMINILSHVIEFRNHESGEHILHVRLITDMLLRHLMQITDRYPLSESEISMIATVSALHDIGKIGIPEEILNKPGKLTDEEFGTIKTHTTIGDGMLRSMPVEQNDPFMQATHEIVRWHHERWDGKGYPDGLKGDEIPIAAQVVALADVYDALTSERCYKRAFSHEKAIEMILNGECGSFNPLLMRCLREMQKTLLIQLKTGAKHYDYQREAARLSKEVLRQYDSPVDSRTQRMFEIENERAMFYARHCGGIQFEYNHWDETVVYTDWTQNVGGCRRVLYLKDGDNLNLLSMKDWHHLRNDLRKATPENPDTCFDVRIPVLDTFRWYRLYVHTLWSAYRSDSYQMALGLMVDIDEPITINNETVRLHEDAPMQVSPAIAMQGLQYLFDEVRLIEPQSCELLDFKSDGMLTGTGRHCYDGWGKDSRCTDCIFNGTARNQKPKSILEPRGTKICHVISCYVEISGQMCILELVSKVEETSHQRPDGGHIFVDTGLQRVVNFYRDPLTGGYTRLYFENYRSNFDYVDGVAVVDVDDFKSINDRFGHQVGDMALTKIAGSILNYIRNTDVMIRYGGDEFLLIFPKIPEKVFRERLHQIQEAVHNTKLEEYPDLQMDISIGGVYQTYPMSEAIRQADSVMYREKRIAAEKRKAEGAEK